MEDEILCPLINDKISCIECMENRENKEKYIPDKFKKMKNWKEVCNNCIFSKK